MTWPLNLLIAAKRWKIRFFILVTSASDLSEQLNSSQLQGTTKSKRRKAQPVPPWFTKCNSTHAHCIYCVTIVRSRTSISYLYIVTFAVLGNSFEICETVQQRSPTCWNFFLQEHLQFRHLYIFSTQTAARVLMHRKRQGALRYFLSTGVQGNLGIITRARYSV